MVSSAKKIIFCKLFLPLDRQFSYAFKSYCKRDLYEVHQECNSAFIFCYFCNKSRCFLSLERPYYLELWDSLYSTNIVFGSSWHAPLFLASRINKRKILINRAIRHATAQRPPLHFTLCLLFNVSFSCAFTSVHVSRRGSHDRTPRFYHQKQNKTEYLPKAYPQISTFMHILFSIYSDILPKFSFFRFAVDRLRTG